MARFNEILVGRYNRMAQKLLSMKGPASLVTLSDELFGVLPLFYGAENRYLEGWDRFGQNVTVAAVASNLGGVRVRNPAGSNVIVVFERISYSEAVADAMVFTFGADTTDLGTVIGIANTKFDLRGRPNPTVVISRQASAPTVPGLATASTYLNDFSPANQATFPITFENQEIPLLPGGAIQITAGTINTLMTSSFMWRERFLEDSERT